MDLRATITPPVWDEMERLRGYKAMRPLGTWISEHVGLPMRFMAEEGQEAIIIRSASINATHLVLELRQVIVRANHSVEDLGPWEVLGFELLGPPPFWHQPPLGAALRAHAKRPRAASDAGGDPRPSDSPEGEAQGPTPGSASPDSDPDVSASA